MLSAYNGRPLGTLGDMGAYSYETKNFSWARRCLIPTDAGTSRLPRCSGKGHGPGRFFRGEVDSGRPWARAICPARSTRPVSAQLDIAHKITAPLQIWRAYHDGLSPAGRSYRAVWSLECRSNGYLLYKVPRHSGKDGFIAHMRAGA